MESRQRFVADACRDQPDLYQQVSGLLEAYDQSPTFMAECPHDTPYRKSTMQTGDSAQPCGHGRTEHPNGGDEFLPEGDLPCNFGGYLLLEKIASGAMGIVYKARQISLQRIVAVKMIRAGQLAGVEEIQRFYFEAESAGLLDHPGIVPVFDVGWVDGQHYFAMGYVEGISLAQSIRQSQISPRKAAIYTQKIAEAVHYAHSTGIVHRDLKPDNVLVDHQGEPRVTDFGLAKRIEVDSELTAAGSLLGTPGYMPPEQAGGELEKIDATSDVYSIGAVLYAQLTGRPPFQGESAVETVVKVLHDEPTRPRELVPDLHRDLQAICMKCLEKDRRNRYRSAGELAEDLSRYIRGEPVFARTDLVRRVRNWTLREPVLAAQLAAIAAMILTLLFNYWIFGGGQSVNFILMLMNQGILAAWAGVSFVLQKVHNRMRGKYLIPLTWAALNPLFMTWILSVNDPPRSPLASIYLLWLIMTCLFRRVELVVIATVTSLIGYLALVIPYVEIETRAVPASYLLVMGLTIAVGGGLCGFIANRLKKLTHRDTA